MKKSFMTSLTALACAAVCALGFTACKDKDDKNNKEVGTGDITKPAALVLDTETDYSVGADVYYYSLNVETEGYYRMVFTGDGADTVSIAYGKLNSAGNGLDGKKSTIVISGRATVQLVTGVNYIGFSSDSDNKISGKFTVSLVDNKPVKGPDISVGIPLELNVPAGGNGIECKLNGEAGKKYTITATVNNVTVNSVHLFVEAGVQGYGKIEKFEFLAGETLTVKNMGTQDLTGVTVTFAEALPEKYDFDTITLGSEVTGTELIDGFYYTYKIELEQGFYAVGGEISLDDIAIGGDINGNEVDPNGENAVAIDKFGAFEVRTAGTYYVSVYSDKSFTVSEKPVVKLSLTESVTVNIEAGGYVEVPIEAAVGGYYKIKATIGQNPAEVLLVVGPAVSGYGVVEFEYTEGTVVAVMNSGSADLTDVVLTLEEAEQGESWREITLGETVTPAARELIFKIHLEAGTYVVGGGIDLHDIVIGSDLVTENLEPEVDFNGDVIIEFESGGSNEFTIATSGTYYVGIYSSESFVISVKA